MIAIAKKEISTFFGSSIGYLIIAVFLVATSLFMWVINTEFNVLEYGYANMDSFFLFSPIILLIFMPAINMQMFAQEYKSGTIELLLTKPISEIKIIIGKYVIVGSNSIIMPGATLQEGSSVGALSFVNKKLDPWYVYEGKPIRKICKRKKTMIKKYKEYLKDN